MIIYNLFKDLFLHVKYTRILNKIYKKEHILENLSNLFGSEFKKDWINRIYTVINPNLINGKPSTTTQIYEYDQNGLNNKVYIEKWIMDRLNIAQKFIQVNNLFDLLTYKLEKLDEYDNYLFVIEPITLEDLKKSLKKFGILLNIIILLVILIIIILNKFI